MRTSQGLRFLAKHALSTLFFLFSVFKPKRSACLASLSSLYLVSLTLCCLFLYLEITCKRSFRKPGLTTSIDHSQEAAMWGSKWIEDDPAFCGYCSLSLFMERQNYACPDQMFASSQIWPRPGRLEQLLLITMSCDQAVYDLTRLPFLLAIMSTSSRF